MAAVLAAVAGAGYALYRRFRQDEEEWDASTDVTTGGAAPSIRRDAVVA
ncbi:MAG: DLW-39 family protein [Actinobacteria bacterium]|nr:DLW-39 family protein [Actinomycetota bacterium]